MSASDQMRQWYTRAYDLYSDLPVVVQYGPDLPPGAADAEAKLVDGLPHLQMRADFPSSFLSAAERARVVEAVSNHEIGHVYAKVHGDPYERYWKFRGFRGTATDAAKAADAMSFSAGWQFQPRESWAEAFGASVSGRWIRPEKTFDDGRPVPAMVARGFFQSLMDYEFLWIPAAQDHFSRGREGTTVDTIVFHSSVGGWQQTIDTFRGGSRIVSAHYVVDQYVNRVAQMVDEADTAWTNGNWGANLRSITIERIDNGNHASVGPDAQYTRLALLVRNIMRRHPIRYFRRHSEIVATACPSGLDTARIIREAGGIGEVPTQAEWDKFQAGYADTIKAVKDVLSQLAHAKHPAHVLSASATSAMARLEKASKFSAPKKQKAPSRAAARAGHGRGR